MLTSCVPPIKLYWIVNEFSASTGSVIVSHSSSMFLQYVLHSVVVVIVV